MKEMRKEDLIRSFAVLSVLLLALFIKTHGKYSRPLVSTMGLVPGPLQIPKSNMLKFHM